MVLHQTANKLVFYQLSKSLKRETRAVLRNNGGICPRFLQKKLRAHVAPKQESQGGLAFQVQGMSCPSWQRHRTGCCKLPV